MDATTTIDFRNPTLERMRGGEPALGMIARLGRSGDIARIAKASGHDFVFIDGQHALYDRETIGHIAQAALGCGVTPVVRVRGAHDPETSVLLDGGAIGIVVPDVNTVADARRAVDACRFPPVGRRSASGTLPVFDFRPLPQKEMIAALDRNTLLVCMIETVEGLNNVEEIAKVEGIDVLQVGTNDLLTDMGKPGEFGCPEMIAAVERVIAVAKQHGKFSGFGGDRDPGRQARFIRQGARFVTTHSDIAYLMEAASSRVQALRAAIAEKQ